MHRAFRGGRVGELDEEVEGDGDEGEEQEGQEVAERAGADGHKASIAKARERGKQLGWAFEALTRRKAAAGEDAIMPGLMAAKRAGGKGAQVRAAGGQAW